MELQQLFLFVRNPLEVQILTAVGWIKVYLRLISSHLWVTWFKLLSKCKFNNSISKLSNTMLQWTCPTQLLNTMTAISRCTLNSQCSIMMTMQLISSLKTTRNSNSSETSSIAQIIVVITSVIEASRLLNKSYMSSSIHNFELLKHLRILLVFSSY